MRRGIIVLAIAAALAAAISLLGPEIAKWLYGRDIVANDELAGNYMATVVTIFSAIFSAGAALIAFQVNQEQQQAAEKAREDREKAADKIQQDREREADKIQQDRERTADLERQEREKRHRQRVSAIVVKANLRPALTAMFEIFEQGRTAMGKTKFAAFVGNGLDHKQLFSGVDPSALTKLTKAWKASAEVPFEITTTDAECVAHMEGDTLDHLFKAHTHWSEIRFSAKSSLVEEATPIRLGAVLHNVKVALDNALQLNDDLNGIVLPSYNSAKVMATSTKAWLAHDDVRLPP